MNNSIKNNNLSLKVLNEKIGLLTNLVTSSAKNVNQPVSGYKEIYRIYYINLSYSYYLNNVLDRGLKFHFYYIYKLLLTRQLF